MDHKQDTHRPDQDSKQVDNAANTANTQGGGDSVPEWLNGKLEIKNDHESDKYNRPVKP